MTTTAERSPPVLTSTQKPFLLFSLSCPDEEGNDGVALVGTWCLAEVSSPQPDFSEQTFPQHSFSLHLSHPSTSISSLWPLQKPFPVSSHCYHLILEVFALYSAFWDIRQPLTGNGDGFIMVQAVYLLTQNSLITNSQSHLLSLVSETKGDKSVQERKEVDSPLLDNFRHKLLTFLRQGLDDEPPVRRPQPQ